MLRRRASCAPTGLGHRTGVGNRRWKVERSWSETTSLPDTAGSGSLHTCVAHASSYGLIIVKNTCSTQPLDASSSVGIRVCGLQHWTRTATPSPKDVVLWWCASSTPRFQPQRATQAKTSTSFRKTSLAFLSPMSHLRVVSSQAPFIYSRTPRVPVASGTSPYVSTMCSTQTSC